MLECLVAVSMRSSCRCCLVVALRRHSWLYLHRSSIALRERGSFVKLLTAISCCSRLSRRWMVACRFSLSLAVLALFVRGCLVAAVCAGCQRPLVGGRPCRDRLASCAISCRRCLRGTRCRGTDADRRKRRRRWRRLLRPVRSRGSCGCVWVGRIPLRRRLRSAGRRHGLARGPVPIRTAGAARTVHRLGRSLVLAGCRGRPGRCPCASLTSMTPADRCDVLEPCDGFVELAKVSLDRRPRPLPHKPLRNMHRPPVLIRAPKHEEVRREA